jgi:(2S)-methylsuccinyl-CoA dehydrogenase
MTAPLGATLQAAERRLAAAFAHLRMRCARPDGRLDGAALDEIQVESYELAMCTAELAAAGAALRASAGNGANADPFGRALAEAFAAEALHATRSRLTARAAEFGLAEPPPLPTAAESRALSAATLTALGAALVERDGRLPPSGLDTEHESMRDAFTRFADEVVVPRAQDIHRRDLDIPDEILDGAAALGLFGVSIPQRFGGLQPDDASDTVAMIVVSEALSRASLGAAGSLVTRPEIMARALLAGGTPGQQQRWLPRLASGESLCAVAITEPGAGSDVAQIRLRAARSEGGWRLSGAKTWCTFAGRARLLLVLARTDPDLASGHRGLTLFVIEKDATRGHAFDCAPAGGGRLSGRAIPTLGYRGMHSYDLSFEDLYVPAGNVVGEEAGLGRGFQLTMRGFAGGRIQTAARAVGVMHCALDAALAWSRSRRVFGRPVADYGLSQAKLARMAAWLVAARQFTYEVGRELDAGRGEMQASLVKLFACRAAEWVTREALQLHGGMGYAEESTVARLFVDARVLSIFEGAEETLALKVIARQLIERAVPADGRP